MILSPSNFEGGISIGQSTNEWIGLDIDWFINKYEPEYCAAVIGKALYDELIDGLAQPVADSKWTELQNKLIPACASYVYFWHQKNIVTGATGSGEYEAASENSVRKSSWPKMVDAWNEMVDNTPGVIRWLKNNIEKYPDYLPDHQLYVKLGLCMHENTLGI